MKILITGASGFFGKSLVNALEQSVDDFECFCVYKTNALQSSDKRFQWVQCDLLNTETTEQLIKNIKPTHVVHLAWYVPPQQFWGARENIDWLYASINLFYAFCKNVGITFIGAGTLAEYNWSNGILEESTTPLLPNTLYGQCKKSLHEILTCIRNTHYTQTKIIWPRIGYFFGPDEPKEKLISKLIYNIKNTLPVDLASPEFKRPYAHVKYLGGAITKLLMTNAYEDVTFNLSFSISYPLKEIVDFIQEKLGKQSLQMNYGVYPSSPMALDVKTTILKEKLDFEMLDTFYEDLEKVIMKNA